MAENVQQDTAWNMSKYKKYNYGHMRENTDQRKPVFQHISCSERTGVGS